MGMHSRSEQTAMSEINVTPLVDVMLVLLIVFIVTAPLLMQAVQVNLPQDCGGVAQGNRLKPSRCRSTPRAAYSLTSV